MRGYGQGLDLPAGTYRLKWAIEGDGGNRLVITTQNDAPVTPAEIPLAAGETQGEAMFTLETAAQGVDNLVMFEGGTRIDVADMRLYSPEYRDHAFTFALLALALCALVTANRRGHLTPARRGRLILIGLAVLIASGPALLLLLGAGELSIDPKDRTLSTFALGIGLPLLLGAALALYAAATAEKRDDKNRLAVLLTAAGAAFAFMATTLFPWGHVRVLTCGLSDYLQFPWRFLMMTAARGCGGPAPIPANVSGKRDPRQ